MNIESIISNKVAIKKDEKFAAIIGLNPSKGARSPKLWNKAYRKRKLKIKMYPLDVKKNNFKKLMHFLSNNKNFVGGAITNPYKEQVFKFLKSDIDFLSKPIGAINCIYKKNMNLFGTNTDGYGAIHTLKKLGKLKNKKFMIVGTGGTALTLVSFLKKYVSKSKDITVVGRKKSKLNKFKNKFKCNDVLLTKINLFNKEIDFLINCTYVGSIQKQNISVLPLTFFNNLSKKTRVFDVIYNPKQTLFLKYAKINNLLHSNGLDMNLHQAVSAFVITNNIKKSNYDDVAKAMSNK